MISPEQREEHEMELDQLEGERIHAAIAYTDRENANLLKAVERLEQKNCMLVEALEKINQAWLAPMGSVGATLEEVQARKINKLGDAIFEAQQALAQAKDK